MFRGQKCSQRCKNSLNILRRQEKAAKLRQCQCQIDEQIDDFLCSDIKANMENLCFEVEVVEETTVFDILEEDEDNEIEDEDKYKPSGAARTPSIWNILGPISIALWKNSVIFKH